MRFYMDHEYTRGISASDWILDFSSKFSSCKTTPVRQNSEASDVYVWAQFLSTRLLVQPEDIID